MVFRVSVSRSAVSRGLELLLPTSAFAIDWHTAAKTHTPVLFDVAVSVEGRSRCWSSAESVSDRQGRWVLICCYKSGVRWLVGRGVSSRCTRWSSLKRLETLISGTDFCCVVRRVILRCGCSRWGRGMRCHLRNFVLCQTWRQSVKSLLRWLAQLLLLHVRHMVLSLCVVHVQLDVRAVLHGSYCPPASSVIHRITCWELFRIQILKSVGFCASGTNMDCIFSNIQSLAFRGVWRLSDN